MHVGTYYGIGTLGVLLAEISCGVFSCRYCMHMKANAVK